MCVEMWWRKFGWLRRGRGLFTSHGASEWSVRAFPSTPLIFLMSLVHYRITASTPSKYQKALQGAYLLKSTRTSH
jgi:hypothetical protein